MRRRDKETERQRHRETEIFCLRNETLKLISRNLTILDYTRARLLDGLLSLRILLRKALIWDLWSSVTKSFKFIKNSITKLIDLGPL